MRDKSEYALLWANGMSFSEIYDLMEVEIHEQWLAIDEIGCPPDCSAPECACPGNED